MKKSYVWEGCWVKITWGLGGAQSVVPLRDVGAVISASSGLTGKLFGMGNNSWGASSSDTSHSKSEALGSCFFLNCFSKDNATFSAFTADSDVSLLSFEMSASEYKDAMETDMSEFFKFFKLLSSSISKSSTSSVDMLSDGVSGEVLKGLKLWSVAATTKCYVFINNLYYVFVKQI